MLDKFLKENYNFSDEFLAICKRADEKAKEAYKRADEVAAYNSMRVLKAFADNGVSEAHLGYTTGYGYDDLGRDTLDKIYAQVFGGEDALVRHNIVNGTMAIATCLYGVLRPGDTLVAATGKPYDTLEEVIGIREGSSGSLKDFGVNYRQVDMIDSKVDFEGLKNAIDDTCKAVIIQRSKGYAWRDTYSVDAIGEIIKFVKDIRNDIICIVDNCYGEFVETKEPAALGADLIVGSLIKNPGGGLAHSGGYIVGTKEAVEMVSYRLTCPGIGRECGATLGNNRLMYQGFFMAPQVVCNAVKTGIFCSALFEEMGYEVNPSPTALRSDIITSVKLGSPEKLVEFCKGIQAGAPIDSFVVPAPWDMPGYEDKVIMAAGAFVSGSSIEISADGPLKAPYTAYFQGGLTFETGKLAVMLAASNVMKIQ
ncbi:MAG: methionine gamma-lyase family protein [Clostridia bacterium]|nr:methionine gamma-lyase family protein [Clostridia bacterium]